MFPSRSKQPGGHPGNSPVWGLVVIFVKIEEDGQGRFYILTWQKLRDLLIDEYTMYLRKHGGVRPRRW